MPVGAIIGSVAGGGIAALGAKSAAKTQAKAISEGRKELTPYSDVGKGALYSLADLYGLPTPENPAGGEAFEEADLETFRRSPDYQVAMKEGIGALDKSAARKGMLLSGAQVKALADYGADLGSANFGNYVNRLMQLVDTGRGAASGVANTKIAEGDAEASGTVGAFNAIGGGISDAFQNLATYNAYKNYNPSSYVSPRTPLY